jgi:membrane dipeptidase
MITRREFTKTLGGALTLATLDPILSWAGGDPEVSVEAANLYRNAFVFDGNALGGIGSLLTQADQEGLARMIRDSGITVLKSTLGGTRWELRRSAGRCRGSRAID